MSLFLVVGSLSAYTRVASHFGPDGAANVTGQCADQLGKARSFDSLLIARHGRIVLDAYYAPYTAEIPHIANSVTKAVTGTLIAIALKEGLLDSLDHPALEFLKDAKSPMSTTASAP